MDAGQQILWSVNESENLYSKFRTLDAALVYVCDGETSRQLPKLPVMCSTMNMGGWRISNFGMFDVVKAGSWNLHPFLCLLNLSCLVPETSPEPLGICLALSPEGNGRRAVR